MRESEAGFQDAVVGLALMRGWLSMHVRRSLRVGGGWVTATDDGRLSGAEHVAWPDLVLAHSRWHRFLVAELKSEGGRFGPGQEGVLVRLAGAGVVVVVWRPSDWGVVEGVLCGRVWPPPVVVGG